MNVAGCPRWSAASQSSVCQLLAEVLVCRDGIFFSSLQNSSCKCTRQHPYPTLALTNTATQVPGVDSLTELQNISEPVFPPLKWE